MYISRNSFSANGSAQRQYGHVVSLKYPYSETALTIEVLVLYFSNITCRRFYLKSNLPPYRTIGWHYWSIAFFISASSEHWSVFQSTNYKGGLLPSWVSMVAGDQEGAGRPCGADLLHCPDTSCRLSELCDCEWACSVLEGRSGQDSTQEHQLWCGSCEFVLVCAFKAGLCVYLRMWISCEFVYECVCLHVLHLRCIHVSFMWSGVWVCARG